MKFSNGRYEGYFINDKRSGKGTQFYESGTKYVGDWKNDKIEGKGVITYVNGAKA